MRRVVLMILIFLLFLCQTIISQEVSNARFLLYEDGWVEVSLLLKVGELEILNVSVYGRPEALTVIDEKGEPLDYDLESTGEETFLIIYALGAKEVNVTYLTQSLTSKEREVWTFSVDTNSTFTLLMPSNSFILEISEVPLEVIEGDEYLILVMPPGSHKVEYIILPRRSGRKEIDYWIPLILVLSVAAVGIAAYFILKKIRLKRLIERLSEVDREIVEFLEKRGGKAYQHEIARELEIPKTTLWRHIMRLHEEGIIEIKKEGKYNLIILKP